MNYEVENGLVFAITPTSKTYMCMQYSIALVYNSTNNEVTATVADYMGVVQTAWASPITYTLNGTASTVSPTNGVATITIDPSTAGSVTVETTVETVGNASLTFTPNTLATAQATKIAELQAGYEATINSGFQFTIGTSTYTMGWRQGNGYNDQVHLMQVQQAIDKGIETFPVAYADINSQPVSIPDQTTLTALDTKANSFAWAQVKQLRSLIGQAKATTTVDAANQIQWTPGAY